jgi:hypothetical protein
VIDILTFLLQNIHRFTGWTVVGAIVLFLTYALHKQWIVMGAYYRMEVDERHKVQEKCERLLEIATRTTAIAETMWHERSQP